MAHLCGWQVESESKVESRDLNNCKFSLGGGSAPPTRFEAKVKVSK